MNWWTGVEWIIVRFLSAVWTLILTAPIHCRASIAETLIDWSGVDYCEVFISCLDSSDGTHSLQSIWCNATFLQICSIEETHPHLERPEDEYVLSKCSFESHSAFAQWWETTASSTTHLYFRHTGPVLSGSLSKIYICICSFSRRFYPQRHTTEGKQVIYHKAAENISNGASVDFKSKSEKH